MEWKGPAVWKNRGGVFLKVKGMVVAAGTGEGENWSGRKKKNAGVANAE
jgi:hypothetical protein